MTDSRTVQISKNSYLVDGVEGNVWPNESWDKICQPSLLPLPSQRGRKILKLAIPNFYGDLWDHYEFFFAPLFGEERSCDPLECVNGCLPRQPVVTNQAMSVCPEGISWKIARVLKREKFDTFTNQLK